MLGVQVITISIHLPLNRRIQNIDINSTNSQKLSDERKNFETKWNYYNNIRTGIAVFVVLIFSFNINHALINGTGCLRQNIMILIFGNFPFSIKNIKTC